MSESVRLGQGATDTAPIGEEREEVGWTHIPVTVERSKNPRP